MNASALNQSTVSNIQKELKPNKAVKGNSVFSNQHKLTLLKSEIKTEGTLDANKQATITKVNTNQYQRYAQNASNFREDGPKPKGPVIGSRPATIDGDDQIDNSTTVAGSSAPGVPPGTKKKILRPKEGKRGGSARPVKDPNSLGQTHALTKQISPKESGGDRMIRSKPSRGISP